MNCKTSLYTGPSIIRNPRVTGFVGSDDDMGYTHILTETAMRLGDLLLILAATIDGLAAGEDEGPDVSDGDGFHRQVELLAYAAELKAAVADYWDGDDGAQCHARLAALAANDAFVEKNHAAMAAAAEQAGPHTPPMHA